ncbi:MAG: AAA family ATPase [Acetobacteraceae bacterium]
MSKRTLGITLNADQQRAKDETLAAIEARRRHLITGHAGFGKTTLVQDLAVTLRQRRKRVVLAAPTHKAVAVLRRKLRSIGIDDVPCTTIQSVLSLTPSQRGDKLRFERREHAPAVDADAVFIDETSMVDSELMHHTRLHLQDCAVVDIGDPAQIPPVGETESESFRNDSHSHLTTPVRQTEGNPILTAAHAIRMQQGGPIDWSWCRAARSDLGGVYLPGDRLDAWLHRAFTSEEFAGDADAFRYVAWTNARVAEINTKVRHWLYGEDIPTPFMPGERALLRAPVVRDKTVVLATNQEVVVVEIAADTHRGDFKAAGQIDGWSWSLPTWRARLRDEDGLEIEVHLVREQRPYNALIERIKREAALERMRWRDYHAFQNGLAFLQSIYAMTVHTAQGSTFKHCFLDVMDIRRRVQSNLLEAQQLLYTGASRPTHSLILAGVPA